MKLSDIQVGKTYQIKCQTGDPNLDYCGLAIVKTIEPWEYHPGSIECELIDLPGQTGVFLSEEFIQEVQTEDHQKRLEHITNQIQNLVRNYKGLLGSCDLWQKIHQILLVGLPHKIH